MKDRVGSLLFIVLASLIAFQCTPPTMATQSNATKISRSDFPADFIFGAASSAYQVEGAAREGGRGMSIWDTFTHKQSNKIKGGSNGDKGVNSYHMYKEDVKILKNLGLDAYRFSISWPRLLPSGKLNDGVNKEGINYYNNLINELLANGITPYVTLFHWDVPQALEDEYGGFLSPKIVDDFTDYVELCFWEFGDRVKNWITLNEPWTFSYRGYVTATFAPGRGNPGTEPYWVAHNLLLAHAAAVELYKTKFQNGQEGQIGITLVSHWMEPLDENSESDIKAAKRALDFMFGWFMEPLTYGDYPESMKKLVGSRLPRFSAEQSKKIKGSYDFLGLNYYTGYYVTTAPKNSSESNNLSYSTDIHITYATERNGVLIGPQAGSAWLHIYPEGIRKLLVYIKKTYNAPLIYITENGVDEEDNPSLTLSEARVDNVRIKYLQDHLFNVQLAINDGVNVKGYIIWTLLDNFEWADGYTLRFGIIYVNYKDNFARYPKASAIWLMNNFGKKHSKLPIKRSVIEEEDEEQVPNKKSRKLKWSLWDITKSL